EEIPTDAPDEAFDVRILPRRAGRNHDLFDPHVLDALSKGRAIDAVPTAEEIPGGLVPRKRLDHLLRGPHGRWVFSDVHVHDASALMGQEHEDKKHLERHRRHGEEIEGYQVPRVVFQEGLPRGRGWLPWARAVLFHRGFRHSDPELAQLAHDAWRPP